MRIFLTGVSCVGKTTIGRKVAELMGITFFDLDHEVEKFFGTSIERLQMKYLSLHSFREEAAKALVHILKRPDSRKCLIALPPSGLMGGYLRVLKRTKGLRVVITDTPENILERIRFYDIDTRPLDITLTAEEKKLYLRDIKEEITYFTKSYIRADLHVDISGLDSDRAAQKIKEAVEKFEQRQ